MIQSQINAIIKKLFFESEKSRHIANACAKRYYQKKSFVLYGRKYKTTIDPFERIFVDPSNIKKSVKNKFYNKSRFTSKVIGGNWDKECTLFKKYDLHQGFKSHFLEGKRWTETDFFQRVVSQIESGQNKWGCQSQDDFLKRCEKMDELYYEIKKNGYKSQYDLVNGTEKTTSKLTPRSVFLHAEDEILVDINRNGEFLFEDGRHRLSIAKILEINKIPVRVLVRHQKWQNHRDKLYEQSHNTTDTIKPHPDIYWD